MAEENFYREAKAELGGQLLRRPKTSIKETLHARRAQKQQEIEQIDRALELLDSMPNIEELLNLLPNVGY